jgi:hypothetical protein
MGLPAQVKLPIPFPRTKIEQQIRDWWAAEEQALRDAGDPFGNLKPGKDTVFAILPLIPSHQAVELTVLLEPTFGREIPETVIKRGGYHSVDEFVGDLLRKLEAIHNAP